MSVQHNISNGFWSFVFLLAVCASGCAEGPVGSNGDSPDEDVRIDQGEPDMGSEDDTGTIDVDGGADAGADDVGTDEPAITGPTRAAISSGGGVRASESYRLEVQVGSPASSNQLASESYQIGVGVGPFVRPPATTDGDVTQ